ncbi:MAG: transporter substrate-binding domain-containing protein, partial [Campylobacterales bacterium]|nr:transporter substrate-binding domain-containing protein [Campylobacterales bacterium]
MKQLIITTLLILLFTNSIFAKELTVAFGINKPPYMIDEISGIGLESEIVKEALKEYKINILQMNYKRLNEVLKSVDDIDAVAGATINDFYPFFKSNKYIEFQNFAITHKEANLTIDSFEDLKAKRVAAWQNAHKVLGDEFYKLFNPQSAKEHSPNYKEMLIQSEWLKLFFDKELDVVLSDKNIFHWYKNYFLQNTDIDKFVFHDLLHKATPYYVMFRDEKLKDEFNKNLQQMIIDGRYECIKNKYLSPTFQTKYKISNILAKFLSKNIYHENRDDLKKDVEEFSKVFKIKNIIITDELTKSTFFQLHEVNITDKEHLQSITNIVYSPLKSEVPKKIASIQLFFHDDFEKIDIENIFNLSNFSFLDNSSFNKLRNILKSENVIQEGVYFSKEELLYLQNKKTIKMCVISNLYPFEDFRDGEHRGIVSDIYEFIKQKLPLNIELVQTNFDNLHDKLKNKECDILSFSKTKANPFEEFMNSTLPIFQHSFVLVTTNEKFFHEKINLNGKKVVVSIPFMTQEIKKYYPEVEIITETDRKKAIEMVRAGDVYGLITTHALSNYDIQYYGFGKLSVTGILFDGLKIDHSILVQKDEQILLTILNKIIYTIPKAEIENIKDKYFLIEYKKEFDYELFWKIIAIFLMIVSILIFIFYREKINNTK